MSRILKPFCLCLLALIVLLFSQAYDEVHTLPHDIGKVLPHLVEVATITLAALISMGILSDVVIETAKELVAPAIKEGLDELASSVAEVFERTSKDHIAPAMREGLTTLASQVLVNMKTQLDVSPGMLSGLRTVLDETFDHLIKTPQVRDAIVAGNFSEAVNRAKSDDEEIAVLLKSDDPDDWHKGFSVVQKMTKPNLVYYVTLAYRFWAKLDFANARLVAENGLKRALEVADMESEGKLKNTLAFLYSEQRDMEKEKVAREYARDALAMRPDSEYRLDTMSFVLISFARSEDEVGEGLKLAEEARRKGLPFEDYLRSVRLVEEQMKKFKA